MRTHVSIKTWLIQRNGVAIGTLRGTGRHLQTATTIEHTIGGKTEILSIANVIPEQHIIEVR